MGQLSRPPSANQVAGAGSEGDERDSGERNRRRLTPARRPQRHRGRGRGRGRGDSDPRRHAGEASAAHQHDQPQYGHRGEGDIEERAVDGEMVTAEPAPQYRVEGARQHERQSPAEYHARRLPGPSGGARLHCGGADTPPYGHGPTQPDADRQDHERSTDRGGLRERVHRRRRPRPGQRRAEQGEQERQHQRGPGHRRIGFVSVPGVERHGHRQPRQQRCVLHRVPRPVSAPPQLGVGPVGTKHYSESEQRPRADKPQADPPPEIGFVIGAMGDRQRRRHHEYGQPRVDQRRVNPHGPVLEDRRQPDAVERRDLQRGERIGQPVGDGRQRPHHPIRDRHSKSRGPSAEADSGERGRHRGEHQQRPGHPAPQPHEPVVTAQGLATVVCDRHERVVTHHESPPKHAHRAHERARSRPRHHQRRPWRPARHSGENRQHHRRDRSSDSHHQKDTADIAHERSR